MRSSRTLVSTVCAFVLVGAATVASVTAVASAALAAPSAPAADNPKTPPLSHVFVIVGENTSFRDLTAKHVPFLVGTLKPKSAWLDGYRALANSSSLGDYIEMTSGQSIACERNNSLPENPETDKAVCHQNVDSVFTQLDAARQPWTEWNESMPHPCAFFDDGAAWAGDVYSVHHDPAVYYDRIEGARYVEDFDQAPKAECRQRVVPMGTTGPNDTSAFDTALAGRDMPRFNLIVPNDCENGHDPCGTKDPIRQFDAFLAREIPRIEASPSFDDHSAIVITWDEQGDGTPHDTRVGSVWLGPLVRPGTFKGTWSHASMLRTIEDGFGLTHLSHARTAAPINAIWTPS